MKLRALNDLQYESLMAGDIRYDASDALPNYIGVNPDPDAETSAVNWVIFKFTYSGTYATRIQKKRGSWDGRVALFS
jgi:ABC-type amino acid transport substrate-binding protein